jgi:flagellin-like protein
MDRQNRAVSSVIATILMIAIVVTLAAAISVSFFDVADDLREPAPNVADTTGEFELETDGFRTN